MPHLLFCGADVEVTMPVKQVVLAKNLSVLRAQNVKPEKLLRLFLSFPLHNYSIESYRNPYRNFTALNPVPQGPKPCFGGHYTIVTIGSSQNTIGN